MTFGTGDFIIKHLHTTFLLPLIIYLCFSCNETRCETSRINQITRDFNGRYTGKNLDRIAFPLGGIGAGMFCIEGAGALSHFSLRNHPELNNEPFIFSAIHLKDSSNTTRVLEGPVPSRKTDNYRIAPGGWTTYGFPRFSTAEFLARFPFAEINLQDDSIPVKVEINAWSPFVPGDADKSSLPMAALEYTFSNTLDREQEYLFSFNAENFLSTGNKTDSVRKYGNGFVMDEPGNTETPWMKAAFYAGLRDDTSLVNCHWFRGTRFDLTTFAWKNASEGNGISQAPPDSGDPSPGASLYLPFKLNPGETKVVRLLICWYSPWTDLRRGDDRDGQELKPGYRPEDYYQPWYSGRFKNIEEVADYWLANYDSLRIASKNFSDCFYGTDLAPEVVEAVAANLTILKSGIVLRQKDGRPWIWEGLDDNGGCGWGSCTHVLNYAQAIPHLFPSLERSLREIELNESLMPDGFQNFRSALPTRPSEFIFYAASDGQLGNIVKLYRDWRISADSSWLHALWPDARRSLDYCIRTWDPNRRGILEKLHHQTYDVEFWGPDGMCGSIYLAALKAAVQMGLALGDDVSLYDNLYRRGQLFLQDSLFNGEYFYHKIEWNLKPGQTPYPEPFDDSYLYSREALELVQMEGPKYQYGNGCISDGVIGAWLAAVSGLGEILDKDKVKIDLRAIYKYNFKPDLSGHVNPQRPFYALGHEGGLVLCTWPKGEELTLPFPYSHEVWTGIEYQVASHLMLNGFTEEGLRVVRTCRKRYDGTRRNPFAEQEYGHWYTRAMASYSLLQGLSGIRYDAVDRILYIHPSVSGDFRSFIATAKGYGLAGVRDGKPFVDVHSGKIDIERIDFVKSH